MSKIYVVWRSGPWVRSIDLRKSRRALKSYRAVSWVDDTRRESKDPILHLQLFSDTWTGCCRLVDAKKSQRTEKRPHRLPQ